MTVVSPVDLTQVDAFADKPFSGNPAAVCLLSEPRDEHWMLNVAAEMNLAETAFLVQRSDNDYDLRWFTPAIEVDLCGHATLASAHVLWTQGRSDVSSPIHFHTRSGRLSAHRRGDGGDVWIELDFPTQIATACDAPDGLLESLGLTEGETRWLGKNATDYLVEVESETAVRRVAPDFGALVRQDARGVIVTARASDRDYDFVSRFFAPAAGIAEDPVTGSAHCCLAPFWKSRLARDAMTGYQASRRGGVVGVRVDGDRVRLSGAAVTIFHTQLQC